MIRIITLIGIVIFTSGEILQAQENNAKKDTTKHVLNSNSEIYYSQSISGKELNDYIDDTYPNSIPIPGTKIRFAIGGYIKADFITDLDYVGDRSEFVTRTIALDGSAEQELGGQITFHAKETRFNLDVRSKSKTGVPMRAYIEFDFFASDDPYDYTPHLRIATITFGNFTIGQNWITAMDLNALPTTIDFEFGDALVFSRASQIRYEKSAGDHTKWAVAMENPSTSIDNPYKLSGETRQYMPNLTGRITWSYKIGHLQFAAMASQPRFVSESFGTASAIGYGFHFTGTIKYLKHDKFIWGLSAGKGWGQNIGALVGSGADAVLNEDGSLNTIPYVNVAIGIEHYWANNLASTLSFNYVELDSPSNRTATAQDLGATIHANLRWGIFKRLSVGIEYMAGQLEIVDGTSGFAQRIQAAARLDFTN